MAGLIGSGQIMGNNALQSMQRYSSLDAKMKAEQDIANKQNAMAEKQQNTALGGAAGMAAGALAGAMYGSEAGPIGMAVGTLVGGIAGSLF
ncbi:hypothetical protein FO488_03405 [Geobacter sp. FeAm09]|nr:hypothetical protein FO488_03405 [Geobacter sp. FeAm09]